jgi:ubiquinone/menaquinone biosynthesis C-methylase UbiE
VESAGALMNDLVRNGDRVLDVGCGTGLLAYLSLPKASQAVGVDLSIGMLQKANRKKRGNRSVSFVNGDALHLPFKGEFDCCVSAFMLVMLPREKRWQVIQEMTRLLKPGGRIAFLTSRRALGKQWLSNQEWQEGLENLGFSGIRIVEEGDVFLNVVAVKPDPQELRSSPLVSTDAPEAAVEGVRYFSETLPVWTT